MIATEQGGNVVDALLEPRVYDAGVDSQAQLGAVEVQVSLSCCTSDGDASQLPTAMPAKLRSPDGSSVLHAVVRKQQQW